MAWVYLVLAGCCEMGWPLGFKLSQQPGFRVLGIGVSIVAMILSVWLLWLAQRDIPMGTAYAVWTGVGGAGTFVIGLLFFNDPATLARFVGVAMIVGGVVTLKLAH